MNYKRKGHRGRHKQKAMDNQSQRASGNSVSKGNYRGSGKNRAHRSKSVKNRIDVLEDMT